MSGVGILGFFWGEFGTMAANMGSANNRNIIYTRIDNLGNGQRNK